MWGIQAPTRIALIAILVTMVGCSGAQPPTAVDEAFHARAVAVCQATLESQRGWPPFPASSFDPAKPDPAKLAVVAAWLSKDIIATFATWQSHMEALGAPVSGQAAWDRIIAALRRSTTLVQQQIAAGEAGDAAGFAKATGELRASHAELVAAAGAAGLTECGNIVAS